MTELLIYLAIGLTGFVYWKIVCHLEMEDPDKSARYYSQSKESDNGLMLFFCMALWPLLILIFAAERMSND